MLRLLLCFPALLLFSVTNATSQTVYGPVNVAAVSHSGDKIRGPATVTVTGVNTIRRNVRLGVNTTYPAGPDLSLPFIPPIPKSGSQTTTGPQPAGQNPPDAGAKVQARMAAPADIGAKFAQLVDDLNHYEVERLNLQSAILDTIDGANAAKSEVDALVATSDGALGADPAGAALLAAIPRTLAAIKNALSNGWPNSGIADLAGKLAVLKNTLSLLQAQPGWSVWAADMNNRGAYDRANTRTNELITLVDGLDGAANANASKLRDVQDKLRQWGIVLMDVQSAGASAFTLTYDSSCSFTFSNNKEDKVELVTTDRTAPAGTTPSRQEIVTVVCSSPLSISGGFGFSSIRERDIDLIQSSKTTANSAGVATTQNISIFGFKGRSAFHPLPLLLLNARLKEWNDVISLHFSTGAAVDLKTGSAAGTDVEYVAGLSLALNRSFFITGGFHAGRTPRLAGGFSIGQEVPAGITKAPLEKQWTPGFIIAFSYKLR